MPKAGHSARKEIIQATISRLESRIADDVAWVGMLQELLKNDQAILAANRGSLVLLKTFRNSVNSSLNCAKVRFIKRKDKRDKG